jgi:ankyrin repeat protein
MIQGLLAAGADVMARNEYGYTPLHYAALYGTPAIIQALLAAGADVMARNELGWTPLHRAAVSGTPASVQALLAAGADGKAKNKEGKTPWDFAQENEKLKGTKAYWALNDAQYN